jgi:outer membrane protein OmpA-like peptidoglycan-associated protein
MHRFGLMLLLLCAAPGDAYATDPPLEKFVVYFQGWSAAIDDPALAVIRQAAERVKSHPGEVADVNGFASTIGSRQANLLLADLRAQVVVDQLLADGVDPNSVRQSGHGPVPFILIPEESRRVEISIERH